MSFTASAKLGVSVLFLGAIASAQWVNYAAPGMPRTRDGKVNMKAPAPKGSNGKPDLSGVWHVDPTPLAEIKAALGNDFAAADAVSVPGMELDTISKYGINILWDFKPEDAPMRPEAAKLFGERAPTGGRDLPSTHCLPVGLPLSTLLSEVHKIVQTPNLMVVMLELDNAHRQIYTDGRKHPQDPSPSWLGYSVGKWEGDALVVETIGFNDKTWLDVLGHPHSESMKLTERYRRRDFGHLDLEITVDDPKMYTKPFSIKVTHLLQADSDILEYFCMENEKDRSHMGFK